MTEQSSEFPSDYLMARMAELKDETERLDTSISGASVLSRALGAVGMGKLPRLQEIRDANRTELVRYDNDVARRAWRDVDFDNIDDLDD